MIYSKLGTILGTNQEVVNVTISEKFMNVFALDNYGSDLYDCTKGTKLAKRKKEEAPFHAFLENQLLHRLNEIKAYSNVDVRDTRRLIAVSPDCITSIQVLIREDIHLMVHFRSSDYSGALPVDLEFLCSLPLGLINHLRENRGHQSYKEVDEKLLGQLISKPVVFTLSFGSLHRT